MAFTATYVNNLQQELQNGVDDSALKQEIINEDNTRHAFIVSKAKLSPAAYGAALESHFKTKFGWSKAMNNTSGDATTAIGTKIEIKCSIEDGKGGFNYVQIRPNHTVDYYLLANYSITLDKVILLLCPKDAFIKIVSDNGQLAHGTKNAILAYREYAYRPKPLGRKGTKGRSQWDALLQWQIEEEELLLA